MEEANRPSWWLGEAAVAAGGEGRGGGEGEEDQHHQPQPTSTDHFHQPPQWPPPSHPPPSTAPGPHPAQWQLYRRRPPHPDEFLPPYPHYVDYQHQSHTSPEISPLAQANYPLYPPPSALSHPQGGPSPTHSVATTPSPYDTPGSTGSLPLPPVHSALYDYVQTSEMMFNAVESARWMATLGGTYEDPHQPQPFPPSLPPHAFPPPHLPQQLPPPPSRIVIPSSNDLERRYSDSSIASAMSSNPGIGSGTWSTNHPEEEDDPSSIAIVKPFIEKLFGILSRPETYGDCIKWSPSGDSFFVAHTDKLTHDVLPEHFSHSNIHSFTRQLNVYNFTRMSVRQLREGLSIPSATTSEYSGWSHPHFRRGDSGSLTLLTPRPSRARLLKKLEKQYGAGGSSHGNGNASSKNNAGGGNQGAHRGSMDRIDEYG